MITYSDASRRPMLRIPRMEGLEPDIYIVLFWNASRAPNLDGVPGGEAAIDYTTPLAGPRRLFTDDQIVPFGGGFAAGGFGEVGASRSPSGGFGGGGFAAGAFGIGGSYFSWQFPFPLRDGVYKIAALYADALGNVQAPPGTILELEVAAVPRPPSNLSFTVDGGNLIVDWFHSPEFAATE